MENVVFICILCLIYRDSRRKNADISVSHRGAEKCCKNEYQSPTVTDSTIKND